MAVSQGLVSLIMTFIMGILVGYIVVKAIDIAIALVALFIMMFGLGSLNTSFSNMLSVFMKLFSLGQEFSNESLLSAIPVTAPPFIIGAVLSFLYFRTSN